MCTKALRSCLPGIFICGALITMVPSTVPVHMCTTAVSSHALGFREGMLFLQPFPAGPGEPAQVILQGLK